MDKVKKALIIIAIYAVLGFILMIFIFGYHQDLGKNEAIEKQEKVAATVTSLEPHIQEGKKDTWYNVIYEYTADDGIRIHCGLNTPYLSRSLFSFCKNGFVRISRNAVLDAAYTAVNGSPEISNAR